MAVKRRGEAEEIVEVLCSRFLSFNSKAFRQKAEEIGEHVAVDDDTTIEYMIGKLERLSTRLREAELT